MFLLNAIGPVDLMFFTIIAIIILLCVGIYFLIPVVNRKHYKEMRDNLYAREASLKGVFKKDQDNSANENNNVEVENVENNNPEVESQEVK